MRTGLFATLMLCWFSTLVIFSEAPLALGSRTRLRVTAWSLCLSRGLLDLQPIGPWKVK